MSSPNAAPIFLVGHGHIDPVWLWRWEEGFHTVLATFAAAADLLDEYPHAVFAGSSAQFYAWVEEVNPELLSRIRAHVEAGRWRIVGGWWVEPDCNIPSGEALIRHGLYGQRFFQQRFGVKATIGFNPDSFGHSDAIPQILRGQQMRAYCFLRPGPHEAELPEAFLWESPDGSSVHAYRIIERYNFSGDDLLPHLKELSARAAATKRPVIGFYGVGNHGGGPTRENLARISEHQQNHPDGVCHGFPPEFGSIDEDPGNMPTVTGDLQYHAVGCYSALSSVKKLNRRAEQDILAAERTAVIDTLLCGTPYPAAELTQSWHDLLFTQFHDVLAGTSIESAYQDMEALLKHASTLAGRVTTTALARLAATIDTRGTGTPVVVFNTLPWDRVANVEIEYHADTAHPQATVHRRDTTEIASDLVEREACVLGVRSNVRFPLRVPAMSAALVFLQDAPDRELSSWSEIGDPVLENDMLRVELRPDGSGVRSITDKRTGRSVLSPAGLTAEVGADDSDTWSHGISGYRPATAKFTDGEIVSRRATALSTEVRTRAYYNRSTMRVRYRLDAGSPRLELSVNLEWREELHLMKLRVELDQPDATVRASQSLGSIERAGDGSEWPGHAWVDLFGTDVGLAVINDAKYGYDCRGSALGITAARSPRYADHDPNPRSACRDRPVIDYGSQAFTVHLIPHDGSPLRGIDRTAAELLNPPVAFTTHQHPGGDSLLRPLVSIDQANLMLLALKQAESASDGQPNPGSTVIIRIVETSGVATDGSVQLFGSPHHVRLAPHQVRSWMWDPTRPNELTPVDLLEEPLV